MPHANARTARRSAMAFPPTQPTDWVWRCRPSSSVRRLTRCSPLAVHVGRPRGASACATIRRYWAKYSSYGRARWSFSAQIQFQPMRRRRRGIVENQNSVWVWGGRGGCNAYSARRLLHNGTLQLVRTHRTATRRTAQIARHLPHPAWPECGCCALHVACCVLHVACFVLHAVCRMLHAATLRARFRSKQLCTYARARATCTRRRSRRYGRGR